MDKRIVACAVLLLVVLGFVIVIARKSGTTLGVTGLFNMSTTSESDVRVSELEKQLTSKANECDDLRRQLALQRATIRGSIPISDLPDGLRRETASDSLREIQRIAADSEVVKQNPLAAYALLEKFIQYEGNILKPPTGRPATPAESEMLTALARVLFYIGSIEDGQTWTTESLVGVVQTLQTESGLKADGRVGRKTWGEIARRFQVANK